MRYRDVEVILGRRACLSVLGKARCPKLKLKSDSGTILKKAGPALSSYGLTDENNLSRCT
jgi:hypothetical protein